MTARIRRCLGRAASARSALSHLESEARRVRERISEDTATLNALMADVVKARDDHRLAERELSIAREATR